MRARVVVTIRRNDAGGSSEVSDRFVEEIQQAIDAGIITGDITASYDQAPVYSHEWYVDNGMRAEGF